MPEKQKEAYKAGYAAGSRTGRFANPNADRRCMYVSPSKEADDWQRGFEDGERDRKEREKNGND